VSVFVWRKEEVHPLIFLTNTRHGGMQTELCTDHPSGQLANPSRFIWKYEFIRKNGRKKEMNCYVATNLRQPQSVHNIPTTVEGQPHCTFFQHVFSFVELEKLQWTNTVNWHQLYNCLKVTVNRTSLSNIWSKKEKRKYFLIVNDANIQQHFHQTKIWHSTTICSSVF